MSKKICVLPGDGIGPEIMAEAVRLVQATVDAPLCIDSSVVKALEAEGIGRPSTYATIIDTILQRNYAFKQRKELVPTFTAFAVTQLLEDHFADLVDTGFTAGMEGDLDEIAAGETDWLAYLRQFYLGKDGLEAQVRDKDGQIDPRMVSVVTLPGFPPDFNAEVRIGQFGPFVARTVTGELLRASLPPIIGAGHKAAHGAGFAGSGGWHREADCSQLPASKCPARVSKRLILAW